MGTVRHGVFGYMGPADTDFVSARPLGSPVSAVREPQRSSLLVFNVEII